MRELRKKLQTDGSAMTTSAWTDVTCTHHQGVIRVTSQQMKVLERVGTCSALVSCGLYFIVGLVSGGDWAPNDRIGRLGG